jgi:hypothetical protein
MLPALRGAGRLDRSTQEKVEAREPTTADSCDGGH